MSAAVGELMTAKYTGRCEACGKPHIRRGARVVRVLAGVADPRCQERQRIITAIAGRIEREMRDREGIALGVFGTPAGHRTTETRAVFFNLALQLRHCTTTEFAELQSYFGASWYRDLSD